MKRLRTESEIISQWDSGISSPLVSICCITFNHEGFIEDALKGFLSQETRFPYEIIIHDDASEDSTAEIVRKYERSYPGIIKSIYQIENQYSKNKRAEVIAVSMCQGKYIAMCDGDDYWTDKKKLQIQADYLEKNPSIVITGHDAVIINERAELVKNSKLPESYKKDYSSKELSQGKAWILNVSWMFRNVNMGYIPEREMVRNGDNFMLSLLGLYGGSHYHDDIQPAVYRVHPGGVWSGINKEKKIESQAITYYWISRYYNRVGRHDLAQHFTRKSSLRIFSSLDCVGVHDILNFNIKALKIVIKKRWPRLSSKSLSVGSRVINYLLLK